jgi:hypothetical protein
MKPLPNEEKITYHVVVNINNGKQIERKFEFSVDRNDPFEWPDETLIHDKIRRILKYGISGEPSQYSDGRVAGGYITHYAPNAIRSVQYKKVEQ